MDERTLARYLKADGGVAPLRRRKKPRYLNRATLIVVMLVGVVATGTVGFQYTEGWPWFKAFYGTLMTLSTIGAEPENELSQGGQIFNVVLIVLGVGVVFASIGMLTTAVIEFELGEFFGRRRMEKEITKMKNHFIVCGAGRVGRRIASEILSRNQPVLMIEKEPARARWAQEHEIPVIVGDASSEEVLREAHIDTARGLASALTSDAQNVYVVLTARGLAPELYIIARAAEEDADSKLLRAGATAVISPYHFAGQRIASMLTRPHVQRFIDLALSSLRDTNLDLQIEEVRVAEGSKLVGSNVGEAEIRRRLGVIVLAIRRKDGGLEFNPGPEHGIDAGDFLIVMGDGSKMRDLEALAGVV